MASVTFGFKKRVGRLDKSWDYDAKTSITSAPLVADVDGDGRKEIVFGTKKGKLFVLDPTQGLKWSFDTNESVGEVELMFLDTDVASSIEAAPCVADINGDGKQEILFGTEMGLVYALNQEGKKLWKFKAEGPIRGQVLVHDLEQKGTPSIIFGSDDGKLYVLNNKGKLEWSFEAGSPIQSTPGVFVKDKPMMVFGCDDGSVMCVNNNGGLVWRYKTGDKILAPPAFGELKGDGRTFIIIGSSDNYIYALEDRGLLYWKYKTEGSVIGKAAIDDINGDKKNEVVFGSCDNRVYALNSDGDKIWSYETDFWVVSEPILEDIDEDGRKEVIVGSYDHNIYVLDSEGTFVLDYMPGLSGIVHQAGHYSDIMTKEPGKVAGKKIWQIKTDGVVVGCAYFPDKKSVIVNTRPGKVNEIVHKKE